MDGNIKIYKCIWDDISQIKRFLHLNLLKYSIEEIGEELYFELKKQTPIIEINNEFFTNPDIETLKFLLNIKVEREIKYNDLVILGGSVESLFILDYALKHNIDAICIAKSDNIELDKFNNVYSSLLKFPNALISDYIYEYEDIKIEFLKNRLYIKLNVDDKEIYTRSLAIVLNNSVKKIEIPKGDWLKRRIFFDIPNIMSRIHELRIRNERERTIAIIGNNPRILYDAMKLYSEIKSYDEFLKFKLFIISTINFSKEDSFLLDFLRKKGNIKIIGQTHLEEIIRDNYEIILKTDLLQYKADIILFSIKHDVENTFVKELLDFDEEGNIQTDLNNKTKYSSIYSLNKSDVELTKYTRSYILDKYFECGQIVRNIKKYLDRH